MKLYYSPGACSLASHIVLQEIGKPFSIEKVDLATKKTAGGEDFSAINPKGYIPAIELAPGEILTEGPAILQHLADQAGRFAPAAGTVARARLNEWLTFINGEVHKVFGPLFKPDSSAEAKEAAKAQLTKRFAHIEKTLSDGRDYLTGADYTIADAYLFVVTNWANFTGFALDAYPRLQAFQARIGARPAVEKALVAEGLKAA